MKKVKLHNIVSDHTQLVASIVALIAVLLINSISIGVLRKIPDRIISIWNPSHGEFLYSLKTEIVIVIDLILFVFLFPIVRLLLKRIGFDDYEE
jgi:hypothetical protein